MAGNIQTIATDLSSHYIILFDILYFAGLFPLLAIFLTIVCSKRAKKDSIWLMVIASWILTTISNLILLGQQTGQEPSTYFCLIQAIFIYGMPVLSSFYLLAFMVQVYSSITPDSSLHTLPRLKFILHFVPCFAFFCIALEVLLLGVLRPDSIQRHPLGVYCHLAEPSIAPKVTAGVTIAALSILLALDVHIGLSAWRAQQETNIVAPLQQRSCTSVTLDVAIRVGVFVLSAICAIGISAVQTLPDYEVDAYRAIVAQAVLPVVASLIFGTQRQILSVWFFCKTRESKSVYEMSEHSSGLRYVWSPPPLNNDSAHSHV